MFFGLKNTAVIIYQLNYASLLKVTVINPIYSGFIRNARFIDLPLIDKNLTITQASFLRIIIHIIWIIIYLIQNNSKFNFDNILTH